MGYNYDPIAVLLFQWFAPRGEQDEERFPDAIKGL